MSKSLDRTEEQMRLIARSLSNNPSYLANTFATYRESERLTEDELRTLLGLNALDYSRLALCRRPKAEANAFLAELQQISNYVDVESHVLASIIRHVDSLAAMSALSQQDNQLETPEQRGDLAKGLLVAARDSERQSSSEEDSGSVQHK